MYGERMTIEMGSGPPLELAHAACVASGNRQLQRLILRPKQDLPGAPELLELVEQEPDDPADALVWVPLDLPDLIPPIAGRKDELHLPPHRLRIPSPNSPLPQQPPPLPAH